MIQTEYSGVYNEGVRLNVSVTNYENAYTTLSGYVPGLVSDLTTTSTITGSTFRDNFNAYYAAKQILLTACNAAAEASAKSFATTIVGNTQTNGLGMKVNHSTFTGAEDGEIYLHGFNNQGVATDTDGWVMWNGAKVTITRGMINPNNICPFNIPIYYVWQTSNSTLYLVFYNAVDKAWKYCSREPISVTGNWVWANNHIVLGQFTMTGGETIDGAVLYQTPRHYTDVVISNEVSKYAEEQANAAEGNAINYAKLVGKALAVDGTTDTYFDFNKNLTASNGTAPTGGVATTSFNASGKFGKALTIPATELVYPVSALSLSKGTVNFWFKLPGTIPYAATNDGFFSTDGAYGGTKSLCFNKSSENTRVFGFHWVTVQGSDIHVIVSSGQGDFVPTDWNMVTVTWNSTVGYKVYMNGTLVQTGAVPNGHTLKAFGTDIRIANFAGFDDLLLSKRELSDIDIQLLYALNQPLYDANPIALASNPQGVTISIT